MATHTHLVKQEEAQTESGVQSRAADPGSPVANQLWINTVSKLLKIYTGGTVTVIGGSAGGGGSLQWIEDVNSPTPAFENGGRVYLFDQVLGQTIYTQYRVPNGYLAGNQVNLRTLWYHNDTSNNCLIKTVATLIRPATDLISSTTNQRTSTNGAVTLSGATQNKPQAIVCDLTSSVGQINGVAISPGDLILIALQRDTADTATGQAKWQPYTSEITCQ